ncbi:MAG: hypothetical protein RLZZ387_2000 [Chloroflexota bacterium]|jgi:hypothetical protein
MEGVPLKIALIAAPQPDEPVIPPLPLGYAAALLEQQRHIVRLYDLAIRGSARHGDALAQLRSFRPHIVVVASADQAQATDVEQRLAGIGAPLLHLGLGMREWSGGREAAAALRLSEHCRSPGNDEHNVIIDTLLALDDDLDALPFPARHLLPLEQYPVLTPAGNLQTPILVGRRAAGGYQLRTPALLISELRSITHEHAVLHFQLAGAPLTQDAAWLGELLRQLSVADLGLRWEGSVAYERLSPDLLRQLHDAGCEALWFAFEAMAVLDAKEERAALTRAVEQAHELGIRVRARISLEPRYTSVPALVDMSATFGLDDARFCVQAPPQKLDPGEDAPPLACISELVRARYQSGRNRQRFVDRYGLRLGPLLWHLGRAGLLGPAVRREALGAEAVSEVVAEG